MSDAGDYLEDELNDHYLGTGAFTSPTQVYIKLHTGAPGEAGTANAAGETTRVAANWSASSGGTASLSANVSWTNVSTTETISHVSLWDNLTAGNHLANAAVSPTVALTAGDDFDLTQCDMALA